MDAHRGDDRGLSTIEVVILAPVMILFILVLVAFGQLVDGRGALDGAARDAARAGSIQKDHGTAMAEARKAAEAASTRRRAQRRTRTDNPVDLVRAFSRSCPRRRP